MTNTRGRSLRLFLVDGSPNGVITAEVVNWTGHALLAPRSKLPEVLKRGESQKTGVYFLLGDVTEIGGRRPVYIGESDNVGKRISQHAKSDDKDFFERFCLITSKDQNLTKAHSRYLESRLSLIARDSGRANVLNGVEPPSGVLPESDTSDMEYFLEQIRTVLPVLGFDILKDQFPNAVKQTDEVSKVIEATEANLALELRKSNEGLKARAVEAQGEIVVLEGSQARKNPDYAMNQYQSLRDTLLKDGTLIEKGDSPHLSFSRDVTFASPSAAAATIYGRNANGRTSWLLEGTKMTLKEHQDRLAEAAE